MNNFLVDIQNKFQNTGSNKKNIILIELNFQGKKNIFGITTKYLKETAIMNWTERIKDCEESQGIIHLDGKIVPVLDISKRLDIRHEYTPDGVSPLVILEYHNKLCAIVTDTDPKIIQISMNENSSEKITSKKYVERSIVFNNQLIRIIDISKILDDIENFGDLQFV